jgi:hypothetical protein
MMAIPRIERVDVRLATPADAHLPAYDNTRLQANNVCPTWAVLRYQMHKVFKASSRSMALEAGSAMHEVFAAVRLWQLMHHDGLPELGMHHGVRLFGADRFENMLHVAKQPEDERTCGLNFCLEALYTSGFYDDPEDRKRTMSNLEECAIAYFDRWPWRDRNPVWVRDRNDPTSDVGIEIPFDVVLSFHVTMNGAQQLLEYRFVGKMDGIHVYGTRVDRLRTVIEENKTASRMDDAWRDSFTMASQVTGYCLAATVFTEQAVRECCVRGITIPLPRNYDVGGLMNEVYSRDDFMFQHWFSWFLHTVQMYEVYANDPIAAPKYTHSCNRYFRSCSFVPFCGSPDDDKAEMIEEMVTEEWDPLAEVKAGD